MLNTKARTQSISSCSDVVFNYIDLPLTRLHYAKTGHGPALLMVPATISEIDNWLSLMKFFGAKYTVYFFELPGHGGSSCFSKPFSTDLVVETIENFIDRLELKKITLMGFSFGGILGLKTVEAITNRVEKIILYAPCVTHKALKFNTRRMIVVQSIAYLLRSNIFKKCILCLMHNDISVKLIIFLLRRVGHVDITQGFKNKLLKLPFHTLDILSYQIREIVSFDARIPTFKYNIPAFVGISIRDPLIDYSITEQYLHLLFSHLTVQKFDFAYHLPSKPFTLQQLRSDFSHFLNKLSTS